MRRLAIAATMVALVAGLGACGDDDDEATTTDDTTVSTAAEAEAGTLAITANEYSFEAPATVAAGLVDLEFKNEGKLSHEAFLLEIGDTSKDEALAAFTTVIESEEGAPIPDFINANGGTTAVEAGGSQNLTIDLKPGNYLIVCTLDDSDSEDEEEGGEEAAPEGQEEPVLKSHMNIGMATPLTVTGAAGTALPEGDATVTAKDYSFDLAGLEAGEQTLVFTNTGPAELHHAVVFEFEEGVTPDGAVAAFKAFGEADASGSPPPEGTPEPADVGETAVYGPGRSGTFQASFKSGRTYLFACFINDRAGGPPHAFANNMLTAVTVD